MGSLFFMDILMGQSFWSTKVENVMGGEGNPDPFLRVDPPYLQRENYQWLVRRNENLEVF
jgi:hypothetical protein